MKKTILCPYDNLECTNTDTEINCIVCSRYSRGIRSTGGLLYDTKFLKTGIALVLTLLGVFGIVSNWNGSITLFGVSVLVSCVGAIWGIDLIVKKNI